jgi:hypothetical protein
MADGTAGWQTDPTGRYEHRYWDGSAWTDHVSNAGVMSTDAFDAPAEAGGGLSIDPTTEQPAVGDPTTAWPAPPVPPTPPTYVAPPATSGPGGPSPGGRANRRVLIGAALLAVVAVVVAALLLSGGDDGNGDDIRAERSPTRSTDTNEAVQPNGTTETTDEILANGSLPPDFEKQVARIYEDSLGLPPDKAACLAGKIADAIGNGRLTQDKAMSDVFSYLADCDISLSEVTGN